MQNCPNFRRKIWFHIICQIFAKSFAKKRERGSDKYEIWCVEQLSCAEKTAQNSIFVRPAGQGANIVQIFITIFIWRVFFLATFNWSSTYSLHLVSFLIELLLVLLWICWLMGLQSICTQICKRKWECISNIFVWNKWDMKIEFSYWHFPKEEAA